MTAELDDFVMLGKTVPEPNGDGRVFVCSAGVSQTLRQLVRVYPLAQADAPKRWHRCTIRLERNPRDERYESFSIAGDRSPSVHGGINRRFVVGPEVPQRERPELLRPYVLSGIAEANHANSSLAVVNPIWSSFYLRATTDDDEDSPQMTLFDLPDQRPSKPTARFRWVPRIKFKDVGGEHDLQLRDWGAYELMRKRGDDYTEANLAGALHLRDESSLFVGNQANRRKSWLVISVLNGVRLQAGLFDRQETARTAIPVAVRRRVLARDNGRCVNCGKPAAVMDHIWPVIRGGQSTEENLQVLCADCNLAKSDQVPMAL